MNNFSKIGFILAALGSSIGLGHIWRFPYMAGSNGGGAFVIMYLILALLIGVSMLMAEMFVGNKARSNPLDQFAILDSMDLDSNKEHNTLPKNANKKLCWLGINFITAPIILSFYSVVMGWFIYYICFVSFNLPSNLAESSTNFEFIRAKSLLWQGVCFFIMVFVTTIIVARGIKKGIELLNLILMPLLFIIFIGLLIYAFTFGEFSRAFKFMFEFDFKQITPSVILDSLGQIFFSLSLGVGTIAVYAANAQRNENLLKSSAWIVLSGVIVSIIAGLIIFTFIYHFGGEPSGSIGILLISLPLAFNALGEIGIFVSFLFFIAVLFAGITSSISMLEPPVSVLKDRFGFSQSKASFIVSFFVFILGFSIIIWANSDFNLPSIYGKGGVFESGFLESIWANSEKKHDLFDLLDFLTASIFMPLGMFVLLMFVGFKMKKQKVRKMCGYMNDTIFNIWWVIIRFFAPIIIIAIMVSQFLN